MIMGTGLTGRCITVVITAIMLTVMVIIPFTVARFITHIMQGCITRLKPEAWNTKLNVPDFNVRPRV